MSPYPPGLTVSVSSWDPEVMEAVRACAAPLYAVAYPTGKGDWQVFLLERPEANVRGTFRAGAGWPWSVDRKLKERGYVALASLLCMNWTAFPGNGRGSQVFSDQGYGDEESW
ncbi:hypothetical protein [Streptomyces sp. NPDC007355]|uniref:hypothetical protein n=1 Tax=Streptomyces sp. NPDC007355 TaxID=3364778 RepID=UPI00368DE738